MGIDKNDTKIRKYIEKYEKLMEMDYERMPWSESKNHDKEIGFVLDKLTDLGMVAHCNIHGERYFLYKPEFAEKWRGKTVPSWRKAKICIAFNNFFKHSVIWIIREI